MTLSRSRSLVFCLLLALLPLAASAELPPALAAAMKKAGVTADGAAFFVGEVDAAAPLFVHNAGQPFNPASVMKLVTTWAALELLGPAHVFTTEALALAAPVDGALAGDLYLRGEGDPALTVERFAELLRQLRERGVKRIAGDLVIDDSAFSLPAHDTAAFDNAPLRPYNAGPGAFLVNFSSLAIELAPDDATRRVRLSALTPGALNGVDAALEYRPGACGDWRQKLSISVLDDRLRIAGPFAVTCGVKRLHLAPWGLERQVGDIFNSLWQESGGEFSGQVRRGAVPDGAISLFSQSSPPLAESVRQINKWSNNVMTRQLFLALADARPASLPAARQRVDAWLAAKGITDAVIDNGAGLSRAARISAASLGRLLRDAWQSPLMPEFIASLPLAGTDGTLRKRLHAAPISGRAHLKTGRLEGVRSLAGYVDTPSGKRRIIVGMINHPAASSEILDVFAIWAAGL